MGNSNNNQNSQLGDQVIASTKQFVERYESKLNEMSSVQISQNLKTSITKDLYNLNEILKGKMGVVKVGVIGRNTVVSNNLFHSFLLVNNENCNGLPSIYCSEGILTHNNSSTFKINGNFFGQSFDIDSNINASLKEIFKNIKVSNEKIKFSNYPILPMIIKDHLMLINIPKMKKISKFTNPLGKGTNGELEIDLNEVQNLLLYFSYCDIIIYLIDDAQKEDEIDYLNKLIQNSLILKALKEENKLYVLIDKSNDRKVKSTKNLQERLEKIITSINHKFYYEVNLKNGIDDKTIFFYRFFKRNPNKISLIDLLKFSSEFKEIAKKKYIALGKEIKGKQDKGFKKFKSDLKQKFMDNLSISRDYREFEEVIVGGILNHVSKNLNLLKSELSYKILIALSKESGNYTLFLDRVMLLREEILNNIEKTFTDIIQYYEDSKMSLIDENVKLSQMLNEIKDQDFPNIHFILELFDFTGYFHKYSFLIKNTKAMYLEFTLTLFNKYADLSNVILNKLSLLERSIINSYNRVLLSLERELMQNQTFANQSTCFLDQMTNFPVEKVLSNKLKSSSIFTNLFLSNFSKRTPEIEAIFPYYLLPSISGIILGFTCIGKGISETITLSVFKGIKWALGGLTSFILGFGLAVYLNNQYKKESEKKFNESLMAIQGNIDGISMNFMDFSQKLSNFENYYKSQATELVNLFN